MSYLREQQRIREEGERHNEILSEKSRRMRTLVSYPTMHKHFQGKLDAFRALKAQPPPGAADWVGNFASERHALRYYPEYEKLVDPETRLLCEYGVVAAIHDMVMRHLSMGGYLCNADDEWAKTLSEGVIEVETSGDCETLEDRQNVIRIAFDDVEADLAKKPAETEQEVSPGILGWIKGWLWKLYEKTLKVVVEAILERFWPKSS